MLLAARLLIPALWVIWGLYWLVMARRVKAAAWRESPASRFVGVAPLILAGWLVAAPRLARCRRIPVEDLPGGTALRAALRGRIRAVPPGDLGDHSIRVLSRQK
jgi:hypothetical protein